MADAATGDIATQPAAADRQPWHSTLYQVVRDNVRTLYQASEDGFGAALPQFVRDELEGYLGCQVLGRGRIRTVRASVSVSGRRFIERPIYYTLLVNLFPFLYRLGLPPAWLARLCGNPR